MDKMTQESGEELVREPPLTAKEHDCIGNLLARLFYECQNAREVRGDSIAETLTHDALARLARRCRTIETHLRSLAAEEGEIAAIQERMAKAVAQAEAPWRVERIDAITPWTGALSIGYGPSKGCAHLAHTTRGFEGDGSDDDSSAQAIAQFIANAPADIDKLLSDRAALKSLAREPTEAMLNAARDWSAAKYGKPIGNDAAIGCWQAMFDARTKSLPAEEWNRAIEEAAKCAATFFGVDRHTTTHVAKAIRALKRTQDTEAGLLQARPSPTLDDWD